ncbi:MAG: hypothetical protein H0U72_02035 [Nitrosospira sp.]|nr:hypothetical protein [Nitrosospira sp.]
MDATQTSFNFLGFTIQMSREASSGKPCPNLRLTYKALKKIRAKLTKLAWGELTAIPLGLLSQKTRDREYAVTNMVSLARAIEKP